MLVLIVLLPIVIYDGSTHTVSAHDRWILLLYHKTVNSFLLGFNQLTENSSRTNGPFSAMVRSLVVLNRSDGSIITAFFLDRTDAESLPFSLEKVIVMPTGG